MQLFLDIASENTTRRMQGGNKANLNVIGRAPLRLARRQYCKRTRRRTDGVTDPIAARLHTRAEVKVRTECDLLASAREPSGSPCWGAPTSGHGVAGRNSISYRWMACPGAKREAGDGERPGQCRCVAGRRAAWRVSDTEGRTRRTLRARKQCPGRKSRSYRKRVNTNYCLGQLLASRSEPAGCPRRAGVPAEGWLRPRTWRYNRGP